MLTGSLDALAYSRVGLHAEIRRVKFRNDRVKIQVWGKPAIFFLMSNVCT